jgi:hypothetical protein
MSLHVALAQGRGKRLVGDWAKTKAKCCVQLASMLFKEEVQVTRWPVTLMM